MLKDPRKIVRDSFIDDETIRTRDIDFAAYLHMMDIPVVEKNMTYAVTGGLRCYWTFRHPSLKKIAFEYLEGVKIVPYRLFKSRNFLKRNMTYPNSSSSTSFPRKI